MLARNRILRPGSAISSDRAVTRRDIHQLCHAHAIELINSGVSIEVVRRRLGHASTETTKI
ncbi:tyrosine-type recombinase/integrase [Amycolatopsis sp. NPDC023774]|uniref:tyrosine-type recombinase/integrase n=1 Tax=Amycolatopsis sp. NPDC023774 TaxID=3155015 RepID=UPI0033FEF7C6